MIAELINAEEVWLNCIESECQKYEGIDSNIIKALCFCESSWDPTAGKKYKGLMQVSKYWAKGRPLDDAISNIKVGIETYDYYHKIYGSDISALNHYNGRDSEQLTTYSEWILCTAEKIYLSEKSTGAIPEER